MCWSTAKRKSTWLVRPRMRTPSCFRLRSRLSLTELMETESVLSRTRKAFVRIPGRRSERSLMGEKPDVRIWQESEFNPLAVSRANAVGLMQLLPKTGKNVAHQESLKHYNATQLFTPAVNLQLGTRYFRGMVDKFGGSFEHALAAYNAGSDRVEEWLGQGKYRDPQEFVESIPFTETREYVQAIMRNASVYKQLYGTP